MTDNLNNKNILPPKIFPLRSKAVRFDSDPKQDGILPSLLTKQNKKSSDEDTAKI